jgi:hypothetical protein
MRHHATRTRRLIRLESRPGGVPGGWDSTFMTGGKVFIDADALRGDRRDWNGAQGFSCGI